MMHALRLSVPCRGGARMRLALHAACIELLDGCEAVLHDPSVETIQAHPRTGKNAGNARLSDIARGAIDGQRCTSHANLKLTVDIDAATTKTCSDHLNEELLISSGTRERFR